MYSGKAEDYEMGEAIGASLRWARAFLGISCGIPEES